MNELTAYAIRVQGYDDHEEIVHHVSLGKAKAAFLRRLDIDSISYTDLRGRKLDHCVTTNDFRRNAKYRQIPFAKVGMIVEVDGMKGQIVGHNSSTNLDILFLEGIFAGDILNCHPHWKIIYFDADGQVIQAF